MNKTKEKRAFLITSLVICGVFTFWFLNLFTEAKNVDSAYAKSLTNKKTNSNTAATNDLSTANQISTNDINTKDEASIAVEGWFEKRFSKANEKNRRCTAINTPDELGYVLMLEDVVMPRKILGMETDIGVRRNTGVTWQGNGEIASKVGKIIENESGIWKDKGWESLTRVYLKVQKQNGSWKIENMNRDFSNAYPYDCDKAELLKDQVVNTLTPTENPTPQVSQTIENTPTPKPEEDLDFWKNRPSTGEPRTNPAKPTATPENKNAFGTCTVITDTARLYSQPLEKDYLRNFSIPKGTRLEGIKQDGIWSLVETEKGQRGYIKNSNFSKDAGVKFSSYEQICEMSGDKPVEFCPRLRYKKFKEGEEPKEYCELHR